MYNYRLSDIRVIDGDTVEATLDLGLYITTRQHLRLANINTPELRGEERDAGLAARDALINLIDERSPILAKTAKAGKFGRWIAHLYGCNGEYLNKLLVDLGHAEYI